jgi:hypothetical protein
VLKEQRALKVRKEATVQQDHRVLKELLVLKVKPASKGRKEFKEQLVRKEIKEQLALKEYKATRELLDLRDLKVLKVYKVVRDQQALKERKVSRELLALVTTPLPTPR